MVIEYARTYRVKESISWTARTDSVPFIFLFKSIYNFHLFKKMSSVAEHKLCDHVSTPENLKL